MPSKQASPRGGEDRSVAERMAREIVPKWTNASAANTMEYENALEAQMMEGHGPVEGLLHAIYTGEVNETVDGFLKFQLLKLGGAGSDEEGPNEVDEDTMWGADPVAAFEASRRHEVKPEVPSEDSVTMKAHRKMVRDFGKLITKVRRYCEVTTPAPSWRRRTQDSIGRSCGTWSYMRLLSGTWCVSSRST